MSYRRGETRSSRFSAKQFTHSAAAVPSPPRAISIRASACKKPRRGSIGMRPEPASGTLRPGRAARSRPRGSDPPPKEQGGRRETRRRQAVARRRSPGPQRESAPARSRFRVFFSRFTTGPSDCAAQKKHGSPPLKIEGKYVILSLTAVPGNRLCRSCLRNPLYRQSCVPAHGCCCGFSICDRRGVLQKGGSAARPGKAFYAWRYNPGDK